MLWNVKNRYSTKFWEITLQFPSTGGLNKIADGKSVSLLGWLGHKVAKYTLKGIVIYNNNFFNLLCDQAILSFNNIFP